MQRLEKVLTHNIAHNIVKKWKNVLEKKKVFGTFPTDLSKAFERSVGKKFLSVTIQRVKS